MAIQVQRRRGTKAENDAFTGALAEFIYLTDTKQFVAHDGSALGGSVFPNELNIINDYFGYASATGTDTIVLTVLSKVSAYQAGQKFTFKTVATSTGSVTLNVNSLGAKTIKKRDIATGTVIALEAGDIVNGGIYSVRYDGTDFQLVSTDAGGGSAGMELLAVATASSSSSLVFDDTVITSNHSDYLFILDAIRPGTNNQKLNSRWSSNNGSSYIASGYTNLNAAATAQAVIYDSSVGNVAGEKVEGQMWLYSPLNAKDTIAQTEMIGTQTGSSYIKEVNDIILNSAVAINNINFTFGSGVVLDGSIRCYGLKASI